MPVLPVQLGPLQDAKGQKSSEELEYLRPR